MITPERTFAMIKPDAYTAGHQGAILAKIQASGFRIVACKTVKLSRVQAQGFYHVHRDRPFFSSLVEFMSEGPILAMVLEAENAIQGWRDLMGPTDATKAPKHTIRGQFGTSIERNATHGSDAKETAAFESSFFFSGLELAGM